MVVKQYNVIDILLLYYVLEIRCTVANISKIIFNMYRNQTPLSHRKQK